MALLTSFFSLSLFCCSSLFFFFSITVDDTSTRLSINHGSSSFFLFNFARKGHEDGKKDRHDIKIKIIQAYACTSLL
jgi:hypothetical protein